MEASPFFFLNMVNSMGSIIYVVNVGIRVHVNSFLLENVVGEN